MANSLSTHGVALAAARGANESNERAHSTVPLRAITRGPEPHWFGYYDKHQFDPSGRFVLGMRPPYEGRSPSPGDAVAIGMVDIDEGDAWIPLGESRAWSWQQGCMLQWLPGSEHEIIYNDLRNGHFVAVVRDVRSESERVIPAPVYSVSPDGRWGVTPNFARINRLRPGYGYAGVDDAHADARAPRGDGIWVTDLASGDARLIVSLEAVAAIPWEGGRAGQHWFNHLLFSPDGGRFIFLHRARQQASNEGRWDTRMFTCGRDGSGLHVVADHQLVSHFIWRDAEHILAWSREPETGDHFHLYRDETDAVEVIGEGVLTRDGHCTYSPDGQWILTDTYPDKNRIQRLMLFRPADGNLVELGAFYMPPVDNVEYRCDLHPRWDRTGARVCIDSMHGGQRQLYLLDVSSVTGAAPA